MECLSDAFSGLRGIARTTPQVSVFPDAAEGAAWDVKESSAPLTNETNDALSRVYARARIYNTLAEVRTSHAAPFVSTATVSRDMLSITNAFGFEKLQYWGFS